MATHMNYKIYQPKAITKGTIDFKDLKDRFIVSKIHSYSELKIRPLYADADTGYVSDCIEHHFDKNSPEILIINAGVGQGKTTAIYNIIKKLSEDPNNLIIMASPFKILVDKDYHELSSQIGTSIMQNYEDIQNAPFGITKADIVDNYIAGKIVHIVTLNSLLGNPGENALFQSIKMK